MRKIFPLIEVRDRTTLLPGEVPSLPAPQLGLVIDCLFTLRGNAHDRSARIQLTLLRQRPDCACPSCGDDVTLDGFRRTRTSYVVRDEWSCSGCDQRFLLCEENVC